MQKISSEIKLKLFQKFFFLDHNFLSICSRRIIQSAVERFLVGNFQTKKKAQQTLKSEQSQGRQKKMRSVPKGPTRLKISYLNL